MTKQHTRSHIVIYILLAVILLGGTSIAIKQTQTYQDFSSNAATVNCTISASQLTTKSAEQQLLNDINAYRAQNKLTKLTMDPTLKQAAAWQTNDMLTHNSLSHTDSLGRSTQTRLTDCGYDVTNSYAESISSLSTNPDTVFNGWKSDPSHNELLLLARFNIIGVDEQTNSSGVGYWTVDFGVNPSISTNSPAPSAITPTLFCEGSGSCVPTTTSIPIVTGNSPTSAISNSPSSVTISGAPSTNPSEIPCSGSGGAELSVQSTGNVHSLSRSHHVKNGYISQFILILIQFLIDIIKLLLGNPTPGTPSPTPCISPSPASSVTQTIAPSLQPTTISPTGH